MKSLWKSPLLNLTTTACLLVALSGSVIAQTADDPFGAPAAPAPAAPSDDPFGAPDAGAPPAATPEAPAGDPFGEPAPTSGDPFADPAAPPAPDSADPFGGAAPAPAPIPVLPRHSVNTPIPVPTPLPADAVRKPGPREDIRGILVLSSQQGMQGPAQVAQFIADFVSARLTRAYLEIRTLNGVAYPSETESALPFISPAAFPNPGRDIASQLTFPAQVWARITTLSAYNAATGSKPSQENPLGRFPRFANRTLTGETLGEGNIKFLDPGHPQVRDYLAAMLLEIDIKVGPSGYLLTDLRYPGPDWGYSEAAVRAFRAEVGGEGDPPADDPTWSAWRRTRLTILLRRLREVIHRTRPAVKFAVLLRANGKPPANWDEYIASPAYAQRFEDWLGWAREGLIDELVLEVHERASPQGNVLREWVTFMNSNLGPVQPIISLSGSMNFSDGIARQVEAARSRGVGVLIDNYAVPGRDGSRGIFQAMPARYFNGQFGNALVGRPIEGTPEQRTFARMTRPPITVVRATPAPVGFVNPLEDKPLVFNQPTPTPGPTPEPIVRPNEIIRQITLTTGIVIEAIIVEARPSSIVIRRKAGTQITIPRKTVESIDPPVD